MLTWWREADADTDATVQILDKLFSMTESQQSKAVEDRRMMQELLTWFLALGARAVDEAALFTPRHLVSRTRVQPPHKHSPISTRPMSPSVNTECDAEPGRTKSSPAQRTASRDPLRLLLFVPHTGDARHVSARRRDRRRTTTRRRSTVKCRLVGSIVTPEGDVTESCGEEKDDFVA